jgi:uncharacterized protein (TIGR03663 family)
MSKTAFCSLFAAALVLGLAFRLARLDARPMHHDEANQAARFGALLETGQYRYDRADHHGPTLYYLTLPSAWLRGQHTLASLDERTVRIVPAVFGVATILLFLLLTRSLGRPAIVASALLAAISPALSYYSRFYIQESLLVCFAVGFLIALGRYAAPDAGRSTAGAHDGSSPSLRAAGRGAGRRAGWALTAGVFAGLAYATKETSLIVLGAAIVACAIALVASSLQGGGGTRQAAAKAAGRQEQPSAKTEGTDLAARCSPDDGSTRGLQPGGGLVHLAIAIAAALSVAFVFYSSFFANPAGIVESVRAFGIYAGRGVDAGGHAEPWTYYLHMLAWSSSGGLVWTEALVLGLALTGAVVAVRRHAFWPLYVLGYSVITALVFSVLRYKTPWNLLPFYVGFVLLAGIGVAALLETGRSRSGFILKIAVVVGLVGACYQLAGQSWRADVRYAADPRNPYAYVQTSPDFLRLVGRIHALAALHPDGARMLVKVIAGPYEQWPLPWYLRKMKKVGYWPSAREAGALGAAPVFIASQENTLALDAALGDRYVSEFYGLRPGVLLTVYIERSLWERLLGVTS